MNASPLPLCMKINIDKRLEHLEKISAQRASAQCNAESGPWANEMIQAWLYASGVERQPKESWAETFARAQGMSAPNCATG